MSKAILAVLALVLICGDAQAQKDVRGSADHPLVGRFAGSVISYYKGNDFDEMVIPTGPAKNRKFTSTKTVAGKTFRIAYQMPLGPSLLEVMRNFRIKLEQSGFQVVYACKDTKCGRTDFGHNVEKAPLPGFILDPFTFRYMAAKKAGEAGKTGDIWATVIVSKANKKIYAQIFVVETKGMVYRMIDAKKMKSGISKTGHVALYGIYFDHDKAVLKPKSKPTLDEIAKLMSANPSLKLIVVGHTDNQGKWDYNMKLSARRAQAVVAALTRTRGIAKGRLKGAGVGFLAPVASNATEAGRAKNRRVELIEQ